MIKTVVLISTLCLYLSAYRSQARIDVAARQGEDSAASARDSAASAAATARLAAFCAGQAEFAESDASRSFVRENYAVVSMQAVFIPAFKANLGARFRSPALSTWREALARAVALALLTV
jgi:hypothetical protein